MDATAETREITIEKDEKTVRVLSDGELFAAYDFSTYARPILYPLTGPGNIEITRHYPMREGVPGEASDHPHHKSVWFAHGDVNGLDFWSEKARIQNEKVDVLSADSDGRPGIQALNRWLDGDQSILVEQTTIRFADHGELRFVDFEFRLTANKDVKFGDTKEGTFAMRTHPHLQLKRENSSLPVGHAANSAGQVDFDIWGKKAEWVCYFGQIDDQEMGIAILDHPANLRHPTTWHARDYGLVAANPFGLHDFLGEPVGSGNFLLAQGQALTMRYRIAIFRGRFDQELVTKWFDDFSASERERQ
jgi:hypothetical protein